VTTRTLSLFEGYGIEIECTVVDAESLDVRPVVDELLRAASGSDAWVEDHDDGPIGWSNELVAHVVELKTNGPAPSYEGLAQRFVASIGRINAILGEHWGARLMPTGMHPWMNPARDTKLWPHDTGPVYRAYDRLFDCRRHGWANVQSVHVNLPFADEHEFARLMAAVRLVLPLVPALAASSPIVEGRATGLLDNRLEFYRTNSQRVRSMTGDVIPEPVYSFDEYHERVLGAVDRELGELDADEVLRGQEWTNARGAIARFDRNAIEIRLVDAQECSAADLSVAAAVSGVVRGLVEERWSSSRIQRAWPSASLVELLASAVRSGPRAQIPDRQYAAMFGFEASTPPTLGALWRRLAEEAFAGPTELEAPLQHILREGVLAERILAALGPSFDAKRLRSVYGELCDCLAAGESFAP
jgi:gamma-glutamyl:cysteine ligase YbdK (ATP-grasp superfamily)